MWNNVSTLDFTTPELTHRSARLIPAERYYEELLLTISTAHCRIVVLSTLVSSGQKTDRLFAAIAEAARRNVSVRLVFDEDYSRLYFLGRGRQWRLVTDALDALRRAGVNVVGLRSSAIHPFRGRCHAKLTIIDDHVYGFGGVNVGDRAWTNVDCMFGLVRHDLADRLVTLVDEIVGGRVASDQLVVIDDESTILVDSGTPGRSVIYDHACELARQSSQIRFTSQFCPTGPLARLLRDRRATCYFNRTMRSSPPIAVMLTVDKLVTGGRTLYRRGSYLHAKFILFELENGRRAFIAGSHNFKYEGVRGGTVEIALESYDVEAWQELSSFMDHYVALG